MVNPNVRILRVDSNGDESIVAGLSGGLGLGAVAASELPLSPHGDLVPPHPDQLSTQGEQGKRLRTMTPTKLYIIASSFAPTLSFSFS